LVILSHKKNIGFFDVMTKEADEVRLAATDYAGNPADVTF